jgi:hypothetical protein
MRSSEDRRDRKHRRALVCRDLLVWALDAMAERFGKVYVPCAAGNHGRNTLKPEFKRYVYKNFDWMITKLLEAHYAMATRASSSTFDRPTRCSTASGTSASSRCTATCWA